MFRRDFLKRVYKFTAAFVSASWQFMTMDAYGAFLQVSNALAQAIGLLRNARDNRREDAHDHARDHAAYVYFF